MNKELPETTLSKGEPFIILPARIALAPLAIETMAELAAMSGCSDKKVDELFAKALDMKKWQRKNKNKVRFPC